MSKRTKFYMSPTYFSQPDLSNNGTNIFDSRDALAEFLDIQFKDRSIFSSGRSVCSIFYNSVWKEKYSDKGRAYVRILRLEIEPKIAKVPSKLATTLNRALFKEIPVKTQERAQLYVKKFLENRLI